MHRQNTKREQTPHGRCKITRDPQCITARWQQNMCRSNPSPQDQNVGVMVQCFDDTLHDDVSQQQVYKWF